MSQRYVGKKHNAKLTSIFRHDEEQDANQKRIRYLCQNLYSVSRYSNSLSLDYPLAADASDRMLPLPLPLLLLLEQT